MKQLNQLLNHNLSWGRRKKKKKKKGRFLYDAITLHLTTGTSVVLAVFLIYSIFLHHWRKAQTATSAMA